MARPKKNNADYFSHDAAMRNGLKIKALRNRYGVMGYAVFCMLLECLTDSDGNSISGGEMNLELLAGDFGVKYEELAAVIEYCVKLELLSREGGEIRSKSLDERLAPVYEKRRKAKELSKKQPRTNGSFCNSNAEQSANLSQAETEMPQSKVKESKEKTSNKLEVKKKVDAARAATLKRREEFYQSLAPYAEMYPAEMLRAFFDYWSELNKSGTKMRVDQQSTWELSKRLATWASREKNYSRPATGQNFNNNAEDRQNAKAAKLRTLASEFEAVNRGEHPFTGGATLPDL